MSKLHFLTFSNSDYMKMDSIKAQANEMEMFDFIYLYNEFDIKQYIEKHDIFIKNNKKGFGLWIWKPKIIDDILNKMNDNDILVYADTGIYVNKNGKERFKKYLELLKHKDMVTFSTSNKYKAQHYVKNDAVMSYYPQFSKEMSNYCYAGIILFKKTSNTIKFVKEWQELCENYHFLDNSPSIKYREHEEFMGNDNDNGLFNLCLSKFKIHHPIYPDEINLYNKRGVQVEHLNIDKTKINWNLLNKIPFQCRRIKPN